MLHLNPKLLEAINISLPFIPQRIEACGNNQSWRQVGEEGACGSGSARDSGGRPGKCDVAAEPGGEDEPEDHPPVTGVLVVGFDA